MTFHQSQPTFTNQELENLWKKPDFREDRKPRVFWAGNNAIGDFMEVGFDVNANESLPIWGSKMYVRPNGSTEWQYIRTTFNKRFK